MGLRYEGGIPACRTPHPLPLALFSPLSALLLDPQTCMPHTLSHLGDFARMFFLHFIKHQTSLVKGGLTWSALPCYPYTVLVTPPSLTASPPSAGVSKEIGGLITCWIPDRHLPAASIRVCLSRYHPRPGASTVPWLCKCENGLNRGSRPFCPFSWALWLHPLS